MTQDIQFQIECLAAELTEMLMAEYGWGLRRALDELYASTTFSKLNDPECGLYYQGQFIFSNFSNPKLKPVKSHSNVIIWIFYVYKDKTDYTISSYS